MLLALWGETVYRPTRDLDFTGYGNSTVAEVRSTICDICQTPVADDGIVFESAKITIVPIHEQSEYGGLRASFQATIARARIRMQIDIGFGNAIQPPPTDADYAGLFDAPPPRILVYPREAVVAEKLHAMIVLGERNSRYKDFYDLHALAQSCTFKGEYLTRAVRATFERRDTPISLNLPVALTPRFYTDNSRLERWRSYLGRNEIPGAPSDFGIVGERLLSFFRAPWDAMAQGAGFTAHWPEGGPWRH